MKKKKTNIQKVIIVIFINKNFIKVINKMHKTKPFYSEGYAFQKSVS